MHLTLEGDDKYIQVKFKPAQFIKKDVIKPIEPDIIQVQAHPDFVKRMEQIEKELEMAKDLIAMLIDKLNGYDQ